MGGKRSPYEANSTSSHPAPIPQSARPSEMWSIVVTAFARTPGWRYPTQKTRHPTRTRVVSAATVAIVETDSKQAPSPPCGGVS